MAAPKKPTPKDSPDDFSWLTDALGNTDPGMTTGDNWTPTDPAAFNVPVGGDNPSAGDTGYGLGNRDTGTTADGTAGGATGGPTTGSGVTLPPLPSDPTKIGDWLSAAVKAAGGIPQLLALLATVGGGIVSHNATVDAGKQVNDQINKTNDTITQILTGAQGGYKPYTDAGAAAVAKLQAMPPSNLAGQFGPITGGGPLAGNFGPIAGGGALAGKFGPIGASNGNLASMFSPIASGRGINLAQLAKGK